MTSLQKLKKIHQLPIVLGELSQIYKQHYKFCFYLEYIIIISDVQRKRIPIQSLWMYCPYPKGNNKSEKTSQHFRLVSLLVFRNYNSQNCTYNELLPIQKKKWKKDIVIIYKIRSVLFIADYLFSFWSGK